MTKRTTAKSPSSNPLVALKAMARRRGCELHECTSERVYDEDNELELVYWLFIDGYQDPVEFDTIEEVEFDLKSRAVQS